MTTSLSVNNADARLDADYEDTRDNSTVSDDVDVDFHIELTDGQGNGKANALWHDRRTLSATSETLDLAGGITDSFGNTLTMDNIKAMFIQNRETTAGLGLSIGGAANAFDSWLGSGTDKVVLNSGGWLGLSVDQDGYPVTAGSTDELKIDAGSDNITYDIFLIGETT